MNLQQEFKQYLMSQGAADVGFCRDDDTDFGACRYAVSIVVRLSDAIIDEIGAEPTHTYFNHYRSVNAFIDALLLKAGMFLQNHGYRYITVAASQSINRDGWNYCGRYSHKKAATLSGLGVIGRSSLFIHRQYGTSVRLGTLFTDCPFEVGKPMETSVCSSCDRCVKACPSGAIKGGEWTADICREDIFDAQKCSEYMKKHFQHIGRGAVCGICVKVCPYGKADSSSGVSD